MNLLIKISRALIAKINIVITNFIYNYRLKKWQDDQGDEVLRIDYKLNKNSIVFDLGGYLGDWTNEIFKKYQCRIFVFEPVKEYFLKIAQRFKKFPKIQVFNFALGIKNGQKYITLLENSSSFYKVSEKAIKQRCRIIDIEKFILEKRLKQVDLIKINIEGGEYDLLDKIISSKLINRFINIQIQFHRFIPDAILRRKAIQSKLAKTHYLTYDYPFIWENWKKK